MDNKIIQVALDGLENILKVGEIDKEAAGAGGINQYAQFVEEAGGMVSIHNLQHHENLEIYKKCFYIMDSMSFLYSSCPKTDITEFFPDDDEEEAEGAAPAVDASGQYAFQSDGTFSAFNLLQMTNEQLPLLRVVSTLVDSNHLRSIILGYTRNRPLYPVSFSSTSISRIILKTQNKGQQSRMVI